MCVGSVAEIRQQNLSPQCGLHLRQVFFGVGDDEDFDALCRHVHTDFSLQPAG